MSSANHGAALPAQPNDRWYKIISPKGEAPVRVTLLAETFLGTWTHWEGAAVACTRDHSCWRCRAGQPNRWTGYIAVYDQIRRERAVLALSEGAARQLLPLAEQFGTLRGCVLEIRRKIASRPNSPVVVKCIRCESPHEVMEEHPIQDSLNRLWGLNERYCEVMKPANERPLSDKGGAGVPLPRDDFSRDYLAATTDQRRKLRDVVGGIGQGDF